MHSEIKLHITTLEVEKELSRLGAEVLHRNIATPFTHNNITTGLDATVEEGESSQHNLTKTVTLAQMFEGTDHVDVLYWMPQVYGEQLVADFNLETLNTKVCRVITDIYQVAAQQEIHIKMMDNGWTTAFLMKPEGFSFSDDETTTVRTVSAGEGPLGPMHQIHIASMVYIQNKTVTKATSGHKCAGRVSEIEYEMSGAFTRQTKYRQPADAWETRTGYNSEVRLDEMLDKATDGVCTQKAEVACVNSIYTGNYSNSLGLRSYYVKW